MNVLISSCLLGKRCRYDGTGKLLERIMELPACVELVPVCPEEMGGLPTPRPPAERQGPLVVTKDGVNVTGGYRWGAEIAAGIARDLDCRCALLKARSPSCGSGSIYDGTFSGTLVPRDGMAAEKVKALGIPVFDEEHWEEFLDFVRQEGEP